MTFYRTNRGVMSFYVHSLWHLIKVKVRVTFRRDQRYSIAGKPVLLPPGHRLPWFQSLFPEYDRYPIPLLSELCGHARRPALVDVGANIGDTAILSVASVPNIHVTSVEGDPRFVDYLRRNVADLEGQVTVVDRFVETDDSKGLVYRGGQSTGGFRRAEPGATLEGRPGVTAEELLEQCVGNDLVVWKSDTDGLDLSILLSSWDSIVERCDIVWFEFDPFLDPDPERHLPELYRRISSLERTVLVYDNTGRHMMTIDSTSAPHVLAGLTTWMKRSAVPGDTSYLDVWLVSSHLGIRRQTQ